MGADEIPNLIYKIASPFLAEPLCNIINSCLLNCYFPTAFKKAHVCPVPKRGKNCTENLRPISLLSIPSKMTEFFVLKNVKEYILEKIDKTQFGYIPGSSTTCALISIHDFITKQLEKKEINSVVLISCDFSSAFDSVNHSKLINKLISMNFCNNFIRFTINYLNDRHQCVRINNCLSNYKLVSSGIPQGYILGPLYFILYVNDLRHIHLETHSINYADDFYFLCPIYVKNIDSCFANVTDEIDNVKNWSSNNDLYLNTKKTEIIMFSKRNSVNINFTKYLCSFL
jgi:hypothetical protein